MKKFNLVIAAIAFTAWVSPQTDAAVTSAQLLIHFNGTVSGSTYNLAAGEVVNNGTFTVTGTPTVSGGQADLTGGATGFVYTTNTNLVGQNWIAEAVVDLDAFTALATFINVEGDTDFRVHNNTTTLQASYWDGGSRSVTPALPTLNTYNHYALVWNATATSLSSYVNGVLVGTSDFNAYADANNFVGFGFSRYANSRGIDGQLNTVALSTFTGTFDPNTDFSVIPEPSALAMCGGFLMIGLVYRRRA